MPFFAAVLKLSVVAIAFTVVTVLVNVSLLISYGTLNRYLAYPWFFWQIFSLCYSFGVTIFLIAIWDGFTIFFAVEILGWLLMVYFVVVVYSYIETLRLDPSAFQMGGYVGSQMQPPPYVKFGWSTRYSLRQTHVPVVITLVIFRDNEARYKWS